MRSSTIIAFDKSHGFDWYLYGDCKLSHLHTHTHEDTHMFGAPVDITGQLVGVFGSSVCVCVCAQIYVVNNVPMVSPLRCCQSLVSEPTCLSACVCVCECARRCVTHYVHTHTHTRKAHNSDAFVRVCVCASYTSNAYRMHYIVHIILDVLR